jgi:hypothetical protein
MQHSRNITADPLVSFTNERADHYAHVLCRLGLRWRLIVCSDGYQWIAQHNKNVAAEPSWVSRKFFRTRQGIESFLTTRDKNSQFYKDALLRVSFLPRHFGDFLKKEKAAAKEKPLTTADLNTWHHTGFVPYLQLNCEKGLSNGQV